MNARRVVLKGCQLVTQHMKSIDWSWVVQVFQILLFQQQELHLYQVSMLWCQLLVFVDNRLKFLKIVVSFVPVSAQHMVAKLCCWWVLQTATRLLHEHLCCPIQPDKLQMLTNQPNYFDRGFVQMNSFDWWQVVVIGVIAHSVCGSWSISCSSSCGSIAVGWNRSVSVHIVTWRGSGAVEVFFEHF